MVPPSQESISQNNYLALRKGENMKNERKGINLTKEKADICEMLDLLKELPVEDRREVRGIIFGMKMAKSA